MIKHHPAFYQFKPPDGPLPAGFDRDFLGSLIRFEFWHPPVFETGYPRIHEEYFEWIALLESVAEARDSYTIVELGAGYGRWAVRAALAIHRMSPMPVHLVAVEADPIHFEWMRLNFADNGIDPAQHTLIQAAVKGGQANLPFLIGSPQGTEQPHEWYGQALADWAGEIVDPNAGLYGGFTVRVHENGWRSIDPPVVELRDILQDIGRVDLLDIDIQGAEFDVVESALDAIQSKVRRLYIGTHSREIDEKLEALLGNQKWECLAAYPCGETSQTPWGPVHFVDGVQVWVNPGLREKAARLSDAG